MGFNDHGGDADDDDDNEEDALTLQYEYKQ